MERFKKILNWISNYRIVVMFTIISIIIELMSVFYVDKSIIITKPWIGLGILIMFVGIIGVIKNNLARFIVGLIGLFSQFLICIIFTLVYDMNGQYFTFELLQLRNDAFGILETIPVNFFLFFIPLTLLIIYTVLSLRLSFRIRSKSKIRLPLTISLIVFGFSLSTVVMVVTDSNANDKYDNLINKEGNSVYSEYGFTGNFVNEMFKGAFFNKIDMMDKDKVKNYLYYNNDEENNYYINDITPYTGISYGNNVITILAESFEWFGIMDSDEYPHNLRLTETATNFDKLNLTYLNDEFDRLNKSLSSGDDKYDIERLEHYDFSVEWNKDNIYEMLFPNLYNYFINGYNSVVFNQFHSKEKTDVSESLSIVGSYPTTGYINFNYNKNYLPMTVPNALKILDDDIIANSFHNGNASFYNRVKTHENAFGLDAFSATEVLSKKGMTNYILKGERNLDSEMIEAGITMSEDPNEKRKMFSTDNRFYTYITSITMHGMYYPRENLKEYRRLLEIICPIGSTKQFGTSKDFEEGVRDYMTTLMEFDKALGVMMNYLKEKNLLNKTTIAIFGDHNAYYSSMSNRVKEIENYKVDCYSNLYKIPFLIYDENMGNKNGGKTEINKFVCTYDIAPTLLDLLGVRYFNNLYYGHSALDYNMENRNICNESIIYSRSYDFFIAKGIHARSLSYILSRGKGITDNDLKLFKENGIILVDKIKYTDQIFEQNLFGTSANKYEYINAFNAIQGL